MPELIARKSGEPIKPVEEGVHTAICYAIYDLGTQYKEKWDKESHEILIMWEMPELRIEFEQDDRKVNLPKAISKRYTLSLNEKATLRHDLETWRGKSFTDQELDGFNLHKLLGVACQLQILHNKGKVGENVYANITNIIPYKGDKLKAENPLTFFSFADGQEIPKHAPKWIADIIRESIEYKDMWAESAVADTTDDTADNDDMPF